MPDMVQNAVERMNELLAQIQRDWDAAELICLRKVLAEMEKADDDSILQRISPIPGAVASQSVRCRPYRPGYSRRTQHQGGKPR